MVQSERVSLLENLTFTLSKNVDGFPVQRIFFSSPLSKGEINGLLHGEGITSGKFTGRLIASDQIELFFLWFDGSSSRSIVGKLFGFIYGNTSVRMQLFLNWYYIHGQHGYGAASYIQLQ